jgi:hypothetical protein
MRKGVSATPSREKRSFGEMGTPSVLRTLVLLAALTLATALLVLIDPAAEPAAAQVTVPEATLVGAGDIASCNYDRDYYTAALVDRVITDAATAGIPRTVYTLGDNAYPRGSRAQFRNCYDPTWGGSHLGVRDDIALKVVNPEMHRLTKPSLGNHEYYTVGAWPYFEYFRAKAGPPGLGYYSYNQGSWHIVVLNSNCDKVGGCGRRSPQGRWLRNDLANNLSECTLAYFHHPLYASGDGTDTPEVKPFWTMLHDRGADVILSGHAHRYERLLPITPGGTPSDVGIRQFIVGTGGAPSGTQSGEDDPNMEVKQRGVRGVLKLDLYAGSYSWEFVPVEGETFTDSGTDQCH